MFTLTVLVPAFNEEKTISESLDRLRKHDIFDKILVLNDGSTDQTVEIVKKIAKDDNRLELINFKSNNGKGSVLQNSKPYIFSDYVVIHDADLEYNPDDLIDLYEKASGSNMILGSRFIGEKIRTGAYTRTHIANKTMSLFFSFVNQKKCTDIATCYKMMPSSFFKNHDFKENGFSIEVEMVAKFLKFSKNLVEVPISYTGRTYEEGKKIKFSDGFLYLISILRYRFFD